MLLKIIFLHSNVYFMFFFFSILPKFQFGARALLMSIRILATLISIKNRYNQTKNFPIKLFLCSLNKTLG